MSRGPGRWQRELLAAVEDEPLHVRSWLQTHLGRRPTAAEYSAAHRAARALVTRGDLASTHPDFVSVVTRQSPQSADSEGSVKDSAD